MNESVEKLIAELKKAAKGHPEIQDNQTKLAERAGMTQATVNRIFRREIPDPGISSILRIAEACDIKPWDIVVSRQALNTEQLKIILDKLDQICKEAGYINPPNKMKAQFIADLYSGDPEGRPPTKIELAQKASMWQRVLGSLSDSLRP